MKTKFPFYTYLENQNFDKDDSGEEWGVYIYVKEEYATGYMLKYIWKKGKVISRIFQIDTVYPPYSNNDLKVPQIKKENFIKGVSHLLNGFKTEIEKEVVLDD